MFLIFTSSIKTSGQIYFFILVKSAYSKYFKRAH